MSVTWFEKTPLTKVASEEERVVFTVWPVAFTAVRVTAGTRIFCKSALKVLLVSFLRY